MTVKVLQCVNPEYLEIKFIDHPLKKSLFEGILKPTLLEVENIKEVSPRGDSAVVIEISSREQTAIIFSKLKDAIEKSFDCFIEISYKKLAAVDYL